MVAGTVLTSLDFGKFAAVRCNLCGGDIPEVLTRRARHGLPLTTVICRQCGLIYLNPRPTFQQYQEFYESGTYRDLTGEGCVPPAAFFARQLRHGRSILEFILECLPPHPRVLDIGCGAGGILRVFLDHGAAAAMGIEAYPEHARFAGAQGLMVSEGTFETADFPDAPYDVIIMTQVLNHLSDPSGALKKVHSLLAAGGIAFIEVLNFLNVTRRCRLRWSPTIDHPYMFVPATFHCMLGRTGFETLRFETDPCQPWGKQTDDLPSNHIRAVVRRGSSPERPWPDYKTSKRAIRVNQAYYMVARAMSPANWLRRMRAFWAPCLPERAHDCERGT